VIIKENTKVNDIVFDKDEFVIDAAGRKYRAKVCCGSFGKRSNMDVKWKRPFVMDVKSKLNNYIGVKYHIQTDFPIDTIALHNFRNGYCGIVKIEEDKYNLCYLTTASNLQQANGSIPGMEQNILWKNPHLKRIWQESKIISETPLTISQISFDKKTQVVNHVLMMGDAAGMITPLCGNGMSMALHASLLAAEQISRFLSGQLGRETMELEYRLVWQRQFAGRLKAGRTIQGLFERPWLNNTFINIARGFPVLADYFIRQTHGKPF
jgi:flavin-dependent dehydrogenase